MFGGIPSPNPDYSQDIRLVTGYNNNVVQNKNLFDENNVTFIIGVLNDNGEPTGSTSSHYTENYYEVKSNSNYAISGTLNDSGNGFRIYFYDVNKNWISRSSQQNTNYIFTTPNNCKYIRIQVPISITLKTNDVQLEIGNVVTTYVAHAEQVKELNLGKNLFDGELELGSIRNGDNTAITTNYRSKNYIPILSNTAYGFSINSTLNKVAIFCYDKNKQWISTYDTSDGYGYLATDGTFTTPTNAKYLRFRSYVADFDLFATGNIQIEIGSTATTYAPYFTPIELAGIGAYKDQIVGHKDNWKIVRKFEKIVADGINTAVTNVGFSSGLYYSVLYTEGLIGANANSFLSTHFITGVQQDYAIGISYIISDGNRLVFILTDQTLDTKEKVNTWLQNQNSNGKPVTFYCALSTPTEETITNTALINQLNAIYDLMGYDGQTNITITSAEGNAQMIAQVSALKGE